MGSSLLTMPWAFEKAGFTQTIVIMIVCGIICYYTACLCIELAAKVGNQSKEPCQLPEFQSVCRHYLGPWGEYAALLAADVIVVGALTVYYVLLSKFLFGAGLSIYKLSDQTGNTTIAPYVDSQSCINKMEGIENATAIGGVDLKWSFSAFFHVNKSIPIYLLVILGLCCIRDSSFFNRFSALGTVTVFLIFFAVVYKAVGWGMNVDFGLDSAGNMDYVKTGFDKKGAVVLPGILSMAYFIHSAVTTLMKDNKNQEQNKRDLGIAYVLVFLTYTILGLVFYLTYPGWKQCITDMFIENFDSREWIVPMMNILMFFRMLTVYPLLCYFIRVQNFTVFMGTDWPGYTRVFLVNLLLVAIGCFCAMFYDKIGDIIRYAGSFCALIYMFFLPCYLKMLSQKEDSLGQKWADVPVWSLILHPLLIVVGICNFISQVAVEAY